MARERRGPPETPRSAGTKNDYVHHLVIKHACQVFGLSYPSLESSYYCYFAFDGGVGVVALDRDIVECKLVDIFYLRI